MKTSAILRIIECTRQNNPDKLIKYAKLLIPENEFEIAETLIKEKFDPNAALAVMDKN